MNIFKKWFCAHKWKSHSKKEFRKADWDGSVVQNAYNYTREILICECCGKIKKIEY